jgi:cytochrome bd-type quinol oxidase subunit 2
MHYPTHQPNHRRLSPSVLSAALVVFAAAWFIAAWVFHAANEHSKDGVFGAPVWTLGVLVLVPVISLVLAPCMVQERRSEGSLHKIDYVALLAAVSPVIFLVILFVVYYVQNG